MATLVDMLNTIHELEDGLIHLTDQEIGVLVGDVQGKIDSIREVLSRMESEENRLAQDIKELQARKRSSANSRKRLKQYVLNTMDCSNLKGLSGKVWDLKIQERKKWITREAANMSDYMDLGPNLVRRTFEFCHTSLVNAYKADPEKYQDYVILGKSEFLKFSPHKD